MPLLLDSSLSIDFTRSRSPAELKQFIAPFILDPQTHLAEPVRFELLRSARANEITLLETQFATIPCLSTPEAVWASATVLGQGCQRAGRCVASLDLLVAAVALHHKATVVTFDGDFEAIAAISELQVQRLRRPI
jgi:predicted nucleic acid-binding protein